RGTLEQLYMSPVGAWRILLARMVGVVGANLLIMIAMIFVSMLTAGQWLNLAPVPLLLILAPMLVGITGLGYATAGLAIVYKQIQAFLQIVQFAFMGLAFVPLSAAPWLELAPLVKGIDMVRQVMVSGYGLADFGAADWLSPLLNSAVHLAHRRQHAPRVGAVVVLHRGEGRVGGVPARHPHHRRLQVVDRLLGDARRHLGAEAAAAGRLVHDHGAAGALHRVEDRRLVERR